LTLPGVDRAQTFGYETPDELVALLHRTGYRHGQRDLAPLSPARFVERFESLVAGLRHHSLVHD
jgi:hypothetical protein